MRLIVRLLIEVAELLATLLRKPRGKKAGKRIPNDVCTELQELIAKLRKLEKRTRG